MQVNYHAFLDESGQREYNPRTDRYYVVAGVIVRSESETTYGHELGGLKRTFFKTTEVEIKSSWLRRPEEQRARYLDRYGISEAKLSSFVGALYDWLVATDLVFIAAVIDKPQMQERYAAPHHPSAVGYQVFLQRYQNYLAARHSAGRATFDIISGTSAAGNKWQLLLTRQHENLKRNGCNYTGMRFTHIAGDLAFADSAATPLLQIADLVAYNTFRQFRDHGSVWDAAGATKLPLYSYFNRLLPRFDRSHARIFAGFGVAKMPTQARNRWLVPDRV